jgi:hypothetical protein
VSFSEVPIPDKEEEILEALADQNVIQVKRILTFSAPLPIRVKIAAMSYCAKQLIPSPFRCKKCWKLGHSTTRCGSSIRAVKNAGNPTLKAWPATLAQ